MIPGRNGISESALLFLNSRKPHKIAFALFLATQLYRK